MNDNNRTTPTHSDLMEEYKLCQAKASSLSDNIWKTAAFFSVGSLAGIISLNKDTPPWLMPIATFFALGVLFTWWRFARRWWSIEHTMFLRMRHIECELGLKANLYIRYLTDKQCFNKNSSDKSSALSQLPTEFMEELDKLGEAEGYECRGLQPMTKFIISANIAAWFTFFLIHMVPNIKKVWNAIIASDESTIRAFIVLVYLSFIFIYGLRQWHRRQ